MLRSRASCWSVAPTFYFRYRDADDKVQLNRNGRSDKISVSDARAKAHKMKQMVTEGGDPKVGGCLMSSTPTAMCRSVR